MAKEVQTWLDVAKSLCDDLDNDVEDVARRLEQYAKDNNLTMEEALTKYRKHLQEHINPDYSYMTIFEQITSCRCIGEYEEDNVIK